MSNSLKVAVLTAFTLVAAGSIAEAASHGQHQTSAKSGASSQRHVFLHPLKHKTPPSHGTPSSSGPKKIKHCDPLPCKGNHPGHPGKVVHHMPPHWPHRHHHHHHRHLEYRYGSPDNQYVTYRPQPSYPAYAPAPAVTVPAPAAAPPASCLTKEYLANGPVLFKDTCTKEWAIGTAAPTHAVVAACLRKEYVEGEKVLFKDICTKEWAMNPPAQRAVTSAPDETAPPATDKTVAPPSDQPAPAADEEEDDED